MAQSQNRGLGREWEDGVVRGGGASSRLIQGNKVGRGWWRVGPGNAILSLSELGLKFSSQLVSSVCCLLGRFTNHWLISWIAPAVQVRLMHIHIGQCIKPFAISGYLCSMAKGTTPNVCRSFTCVTGDIIKL